MFIVFKYTSHGAMESPHSVRYDNNVRLFYIYAAIAGSCLNWLEATKIIGTGTL